VLSQMKLTCRWNFCPKNPLTFVPKKIIWLFRVSLSTIIFLPTLTHFIRILGHALLKSRNAPYLINVKRFWKIKWKCLPTYLPYFSRQCNPKQTYYFFGLSFYTQIHTLFSSCSIFFTHWGFFRYTFVWKLNGNIIPHFTFLYCWIFHSLFILFKKRNQT